ncbi:MAG: hypothetical protein FWD69_18885 [Polyangiaceae bacterium]|nr:hypothetical protein [Polyangiaceae bacterium]
MKRRVLFSSVTGVLLSAAAGRAWAQAAPAEQSTEAQSKEPLTTNAAAPAGRARPMSTFRDATTWDLNLEGGYGYAFGDAHRGSALLRARPGVLFIRDSSVWQAGATVEWTSIGKELAFGVQAEYMHIGLGTWIQGGASVDAAARFGGMAAVGLSVFGVEAQVRNDGFDSPIFALYAKIRIPIGLIVYAISSR